MRLKPAEDLEIMGANNMRLKPAEDLEIMRANNMRLKPAEDLEIVRTKYIDVINNTPGIDRHARWVYGKHPDDDLLRSYIENGEMYLLMDDGQVAGMAAIVMR